MPIHTPRSRPPGSRTLGTRSSGPRSLAILPRVLLVGFLLAGTLAAAGLEGTWRMDLERSDAMQGGMKVENTYALELQGEDLKVRRTFFRGGESTAIDWIFVTDGKAHEIPGMRAPRKARAKWKKDKLNVSYSVTLETPRGAFDLDVTETWQINKDGDLEIRYVTRTPRGPQSRVELYVREPAAEAPGL